jgi:Flp pilus assembly protein TadG
MPILNNATSLLRRLISRREGNIAIMFGLALLPMFVAVGMAVDISRAYSVRTRLNSALDDAALALGSAPAGYTTAQLNNMLQTYVAANFTKNAMGSVTSASYTASANGTVYTIIGTATVPTTLTRVLPGAPAFLTVSSSSVIKKTLGVELALVLDNTGSMLCGDGSGANYSPCNTPDHIVALQTATSNQLLKPLFAQSPDPTLLKVALIPYVTTVNVGPALASAGLLPTALKHDVNSHYLDLAGNVINDHSAVPKPITFDANQSQANETTPEWRGCVIEDTPNNEDSGTPAGFDVTEPNGGWLSAVGASSPLAHTPWIALYWQPGGNGTGGTWNTWNTGNISYLHTPGNLLSLWDTSHEYGPNSGCPTPMQRLVQMDAAGQAAAYAGVAAQEGWAAGGTMIHEGLIWGWRALSPNPPFSDGVPYAQTAGANPTWAKVVVLETDGVNESFTTENTGFSYLSDGKLGTTNNTTTSVNNLNTRLTTICQNMHTANIVIYTVGFGASAQFNTQLQNCAGGPTTAGLHGRFIYAADSAALASAFAAIAGEINQLRIAQ